MRELFLSKLDGPGHSRYYQRAGVFGVRGGCQPVVVQGDIRDAAKSPGRVKATVNTPSVQSRPAHRKSVFLLVRGLVRAEPEFATRAGLTHPCEAYIVPERYVLVRQRETICRGKIESSGPAK
jgi:hypothetical protein